MTFVELPPCTKYLQVLENQYSRETGPSGLMQLTFLGTTKGTKRTNKIISEWTTATRKIAGAMWRRVRGQSREASMRR